MPNSPVPAAYRFGQFTLSSRRRLLLRDDTPVPLIPKYFDLLRLLIERRAEALDRREIFDLIWPDVVVSESALTQAVRTLRRALDDSPRTPVYIRTVSRHGYQFVYEPVVVVGHEEPGHEGREEVSHEGHEDFGHEAHEDHEEDEAGAQQAGGGGMERQEPPEGGPHVRVRAEVGGATHAATTVVVNGIDELTARVLGADPYGGLSDEESREAAEQLHALGTTEALARIAHKPGAARARALLRDSRWDVPGAGDVPLLRSPQPLRSVYELLALRIRRAARAAASRLGFAATGGGVAGIAAGALGGVAMMLPGGSPVTGSTVMALMIIAGSAGLFGAAVIGAGLAAAEVLARSRRRLALALCGLASGLVAGALARSAVMTVFGSVVGRAPEGLGGPLEGSVIGLAAGIGYAWSTHTPAGGGMATPRGGRRLTAGVVTALCCAVAAAALVALGGRTVSVTLDGLSHVYAGATVGLAPLGSVLGEQELRPMTRTLVSGFEGLAFGFGLAIGLTHRPFRT